VQRSCRCSRGADAEMQVQRWLSIGCAEVQMWFSAEVMNCAGAEQAGAELVQKSTRGDWAGAEVLQGWALVQRWCRLNAEMKRRC